MTGSVKLDDILGHEMDLTHLRALLVREGYIDPVVHQVQALARHRDLSAEHMATLLACYKIAEANEVSARALRIAMESPAMPPGVNFKPH